MPSDIFISAMFGKTMFCQLEDGRDVAPCWNWSNKTIASPSPEPELLYQLTSQVVQSDVVFIPVALIFQELDVCVH
jgi:hypothetical protein